MRLIGSVENILETHVGHEILTFRIASELGQYFTPVSLRYILAVIEIHRHITPIGRVCQVGLQSGNTLLNRVELCRSIRGKRNLFPIVGVKIPTIGTADNYLSIRFIRATGEQSNAHHRCHQ